MTTTISHTLKVTKQYEITDIIAYLGKKDK